MYVLGNLRAELFQAGQKREAAGLESGISFPGVGKLD